MNSTSNRTAFSAASLLIVRRPELLWSNREAVFSRSYHGSGRSSAAEHAAARHAADNRPVRNFISAPL
ncbi:MAG: hypothetical protein HP002_09740 [Lentisphaeria bacterium]|nr:hypothetical protein [Lentisphaeria bacterium]